MRTAPAVETNTAQTLEQISAANLASIEREYLAEAVAKGQFASPDLAEQALAATERNVSEYSALTVNMSAASMTRLMKVGRMETYWGYAPEIAKGIGAIATANGKNHHDEYAVYRRLADDGLRAFAPEDVRHRDPVYAALAGPRERKTGAAPAYGNWWIELSDAPANRAVYHFSDSHSSVRAADEGLVFDQSGVLDAKDAPAAKAVSELMRQHNNSLGMMISDSVAVDVDPEKVISVNGRSGYIEAAIFDEITLDRIAKVNAALLEYNQIFEAADVLSGATVPAEKIKLLLGQKVEPLVTEWLSARYDAELTESAQKQQPTSITLKDLGLTPQTPYEMVAATLDEKAAEQWKGVCRLLLMLPAPRVCLISLIQ